MRPKLRGKGGRKGQGRGAWGTKTRRPAVARGLEGSRGSHYEGIRMGMARATFADCVARYQRALFAKGRWFLGAWRSTCVGK